MATALIATRRMNHKLDWTLRAPDWPQYWSCFLCWQRPGKRTLGLIQRDHGLRMRMSMSVLNPEKYTSFNLYFPP